MEAVIAVVYLDQGWVTARDFVLRLLGTRIGVAADGSAGRDYKTRLQELAAHMSLGRPRYQVSDVGPDHAKRFFATVFLTGVAYGSGEGRSKKEAEQEAAWKAWLELNGEPVPHDAADSRPESMSAAHPHKEEPDAGAA
jgi:ribonuclease-3